MAGKVARGDIRLFRFPEPDKHRPVPVLTRDSAPSRPGYHNILSRATDSAGNVQPFVAEWNPSGYLYNAIDRVGITVEKSA